MSTDKYILGTLNNAILVLNYVADNGYSTLAQISENLGLNKTVVFRILHTFQRYNYIAKADNFSYILGSKLVYNGKSALKHNAIHQQVKGHLKVLTGMFNETSHLGILNDDDEVLIVAKVDADSTMQMMSNIGRTLQAYCSAMGKCLLAFQSAQETMKYIDQVRMVRKTPQTLTTAEELLSDLEAVRARGYALDDEESEEGLFCIAVPVRNGNGAVYAALSVSGPVNRMKNKREMIIEQLMHTAGDIQSADTFSAEQVKPER